MADSTPTKSEVIAMMAQLGEVKGQLNGIAAMIAANHTATHQRIDDLRHAIEGRVRGVEDRVERLEGNERSTAVRVGSIAATTSALVAGGIEIVRRISGH